MIEISSTYIHTCKRTMPLHSPAKHLPQNKQQSYVSSSDNKLDYYSHISTILVHPVLRCILYCIKESNTIADFVGPQLTKSF